MPTPKKGYWSADGKTQFPSVTTITGRFKDAGPLIHWAWQAGRDGKDYRELRDAAASVGSVIHAQAEAAITQQEIPYPPADFTDEQQAQVRQGFHAFWRWYSSTVRAIDWTEKQMVSEKHRFGGTPDAYGRDKEGRGCLFDWKSGGVYQDALIQVGGGYAILCEEAGLDLSGGFHIVRFNKDTGDFVHRHYPELDAARDQFLRLRECYDIDRLLKKRL